MASLNGGSPTPTIPWDSLRAYVDEQQAWEHEHGQPARLSGAKRAAISTLLLLDVVEPEITENYVSRLNEYAQARRYESPLFGKESVLEGTPAKVRWRTTCTLPWSKDSFPRPGYGFGAGEEPPSFAKEKTAKQFAAQQALQFLDEGNHHNNNVPPSSTPSPPPIASTSSHPPAAATVSLGDNVTSVAADFMAEPSRNSQVQATTTVDPDDDDERPTIYEKVAAHAGSLHLNVPRYVVEPHPEMHGFFFGRAEFTGNGPKPPAGVGVVSGILGRKQAKEEIANRVLTWLEGENQRLENKRLENIFQIRQENSAQ